MTDSEFGKGLTYCLGLFLAHAERWAGKKGKELEKIMKDDFSELWFNSASDHLCELQIPESLPKVLRARLTLLRDKAIHWGHNFKPPKATKRDMSWAIQEAKDLLRLIDKHWGIETKKGKWE